MNIVCPNCTFARSVHADSIPTTSVIATCPRCGYRFRIIKDAASATGLRIEDCIPQSKSPSADTVQTTTLCQHTQKKDNAYSQDDPLPPGAVIPSVHTQNTVHAEETTTHAAGNGVPSHEHANAPEPTPSDQNVNSYQQIHDAALAESYAISNPWEQPERYGYISAFYQTIIRVMFAASRFFSGLSTTTPQNKPLFFYLIVSVSQIIIEYAWSGIISGALSSGGATDPQLQQLVQMLTPQTNIFMAVLLRTGLVTLELFVTAGLFYLAFKLTAPQNANFQLLFQVLAYSSAPAMLCIIPIIGSAVGFVWGIACSVIGCRYALKLSWMQTFLGLLPVYALGVPVILVLLQSSTALG